MDINHKSKTEDPIKNGQYRDTGITQKQEKTHKTQHRKLKRRAIRILPNLDICEVVLVYYKILDKLLVVKPGQSFFFGIIGGNNLRNREKIHCQMNFLSGQSVHDEYHQMVFFLNIMPYQIFSLLNLDTSVVGNKTSVFMIEYTQNIIQCHHT